MHTCTWPVDRRVSIDQLAGGPGLAPVRGSSFIRFHRTHWLSLKIRNFRTYVRTRAVLAEGPPVFSRPVCVSRHALSSVWLFTSLSLSFFLSMLLSRRLSNSCVAQQTHGLAAGFLMFTPVVDAKIGQAYRAPPTRKRKKRSAAKTWGRLGTLQTVRRLLWPLLFVRRRCWSFFLTEDTGSPWKLIVKFGNIHIT